MSLQSQPEGTLRLFGNAVEKMFDRLEEIGCRVEDEPKAQLLILILGSDLWADEGCIPVDTLVVEGKQTASHLRSMARCGGIRPCSHGCLICDQPCDHWQCLKCSSFAECLYNLALFWSKYARVVSGACQITLNYDQKGSKLDKVWLDLISTAIERSPVAETTLLSMVEFAQHVLSIRDETLTDEAKQSYANSLAGNIKLVFNKTAGDHLFRLAQAPEELGIAY